SVAARTKRIVQVGTQQRSGAHYLKARELIRGGHIGAVTSVRITSIRNAMPGFGSPPDGPPPPDLDYDEWLGPAPLRTYHPHRGAFPLIFHGTRGSLGLDRRRFLVTPDPGTPPINTIPGALVGHPAGGPKAEPLTGREPPRTQPIEDATGDSAGQYLAHAQNF